MRIVIECDEEVESIVLKLKKTDLTLAEALTGQHKHNDYVSVLAEFLGNDEDMMEVEYEKGKQANNITASINNAITRNEEFKGLVAFQAKNRVFITFGENLPENSTVKTKYERMLEGKAR